MVYNLYMEVKKRLTDLTLKEYVKSQDKLEARGIFWRNSEYKEIREISIDTRGRIGEHLLKEMFEEAGYLVEYIDNDHGDYDIIIDGVKIEIKSATLDSSNKFQHEGIKDSELWDLVAFVDIAPENIYITFIPHSEFRFEPEGGTVMLNGEIRNIHCRSKDKTDKNATGAGYKVDFPREKLIEIYSSEDIIKAFEIARKK